MFGNLDEDDLSEITEKINNNTKLCKKFYKFKGNKP